MDLKELNHAGEHAVFGSIKVLGDIDGKNVRTIRRDVDLIQNTQYKLKQKVDNYWSSLSDDGIITPVEKIALHKEWESIVQSHAALYEQAQEKQLTEMPYWQDYEDAYDALKKMLFTDEGIFDLMEDNTELINVDNFNNKFSEYYYAEKFIQLALATGIIDKLGLRTLTSLDDPGADGDLAFYRGELYQHVNGVWVKVGTEDYLGTLSSLQPALWSATQGQYFLVSSDFVITEAFYVNDEPFFVNDEPFYVGHITTEYAKIYYYDGKWKKAQDSDPRYIAILVDYMALTGELPESLTNRIIEVINNTLPQYHGVSDIAPVNPHEGDWFYYVGVTTGDTKYDWIKGRIHIYKGNSWENMAADDDTASQYYMRALQDILTYEVIDENGYFSNIFCNAFFTNKASINALRVQTIFLYDTGALQSENATYSPGQVGLRIDAAGNIDANGTAHIKGPCAIGMQLSELGNYNIGIGGNAKISGEINATGGTFSSSCKFYGKMYSNGIPFLLLGAVNFGYNNGLKTISAQNVTSITRVEEGVYQLNFTNPIWLKTHTYAGNKYIDVFAFGNAADNFDSGFVDNLLINPNWLRQYVNGRLTISGDYALVSYVVLYFIDTGNTLVDPISAQILLMGAEITI